MCIRVGTARMGSLEEFGVVDSKLNLYGTSNVKIADASIIPIIPNGNVHSTVTMVAWRAAEFLLNDRNRSLG